MAGDLGRAIENTDIDVRSRQHERAPNSLWRNGIVVEVEVHVDGLAGSHGHNQIRGKGMQRQWQQAQLLFAECLGDSAGAIVGPAALVRDRVSPRQGLAVALDQGSEGAARPEGIPYEPNRPFHAALLISFTYLARTGVK